MNRRIPIVVALGVWFLVSFSCDKAPSHRTWILVGEDIGGDSSFQDSFLLLRADVGYPSGCDTLKHADQPLSRDNIEYRELEFTRTEVQDLQELAARIPTGVGERQSHRDEKASDVSISTRITWSDGTGIIHTTNLPGAFEDWTGSGTAPELSQFILRILEIRRARCV